jgi:hypothetical protein
MFAKLAKLAEPRTIESRRAMLGVRRVIHSGDNRRSVGPTTATQQNRRQVLVCHWHSGLGNGRLECSWHIEPADDSLGERAGFDLCLLGEVLARPAVGRRDVKG